MPITFYYLSGSPFSWKVWLALEHKRLDYELRTLSADAGDLKKPEFTTINPRAKVPAITDGGFALYESEAIIEYLEDMYPQSGGRLWPQDVQSRAIARRIAGEADGYVYPHVRKLVVELLMRRDSELNTTVVVEAKSALASEFSYLERAIAGTYLAGGEPSAADFALYPLTAILDRIQSRRPEQKVAEIFTGTIRGWMSRVEALSYFSRTLPPHWRQS